MEVRCEKCEQLIDVDNINIKDMIAKCTDCKHIFNCRSQLALETDKTGNI